MNEPDGISLTNDAPALDLMLVANSAVLGTDGAITTTPTRTPSTVFDFGNIVHTLESTAKSVKLTGLSEARQDRARWQDGALDDGGCSRQSHHPPLASSTFRTPTTAALTRSRM